MLLRTSSTPILTPLIKSKEITSEVGISKNCLTFSHSHCAISVFSTCHEAANRDVSFLAGGEWNFEQKLVTSRKIRKVQSENDLQILSSRSTPSAKASANEAFNRICVSGLNVLRENRSRHQSEWSRRMLLRSYCSLPPNFSPYEDNISSDSRFTSPCVPKSLLKEIQWASEDEGELEDSEYVDDSTTDPANGYQNVGHLIAEQIDECSESRNLDRSDPEVSLQEKYLTRNVLTSACDALRTPSEIASERLGESEGQHSTPVRHAEPFFVIDGERYTTIRRAANGVTVACNSRGCIPLNTSESLGPMFISGGLGVDANGNSGVFHYNRSTDSGDKFPKAEENYIKLLEANPGHPLLLRNYARFLFEVRQDFPKAEEYFERAILAGPADGELLAQYAKLIWQIYHDEARAGSYFEQAVQAAPDDCYVLTAYASFLWESEDTEQDSQHSEINSPIHAATPVPV